MCSNMISRLVHLGLISVLGGREHAGHHKHTLVKHTHKGVFVVFEMRERRGGRIGHQNMPSCGMFWC